VRVCVRALVRVCVRVCVCCARPWANVYGLLLFRTQDPLNGQCYGASVSRWDPVPFQRKHGGFAITGTATSISKMIRPIAAFTATPLGMFVGGISGFTAALSGLPPFSTLGKMDERTQRDVWALWHVLVIIWPLLHQILIDRQAPKIVARLLSARDARMHAGASTRASCAYVCAAQERQ